MRFSYVAILTVIPCVFGSANRVGDLTRASSRLTPEKLLPRHVAIDIGDKGLPDLAAPPASAAPLPATALPSTAAIPGEEAPILPKRWLLSLDGGGIRGIMQLNMLAAIERHTGKAIVDLFDGISGTSIGGLIACLLTLPDPENPGRPKYSAQYLLNFLLKNKERMFAAKWFSLGGFFKTVYKTTSAKNLLRELLGDNQFSQRLLPTIITTNDLRLKQARFFSSTDAELFHTRDLAIATAAAPTYFKPQLVFPIDATPAHMGYLLSDGGTCMNNPVEIGKLLIHETYRTNLNDIEILSLRTGHIGGIRDVSGLMRGGALAWMRSIASTCVSGNSSAAHYIASRINGNRYHCYNPLIGEENTKLDNISDKNVSELLLASHQTMHDECGDFFKTVETIERNFHLRLAANAGAHFR